MITAATKRNRSLDLVKTLAGALSSNLGDLTAFAFLIAVSWFSIALLTPPPAKPIDASAAEFSAARALSHVEMIARHPHPVGAAAHAETRRYIIDQLSKLGVQPEVQEATILSEDRTPLAAAMVYNIIGKLPGASSKGAILLAAHYDSAPMSYGANDDGAGVATLLETLRSLKSQPPLQNDVVFLFTDGEEIGLMGARAFVKEHPLAREVKLALNFESRGTRGPSLMFETTPNNANLIREFSRSAEAPIANSLMYEIYRFMPNDTDFSVFRRAGMEGLNFAYIDDADNYHSANDSPTHIDARSLQHHGSYALSMTKQYGNKGFEQAENGSAVYFNLIGGRLIVYPSYMAYIVFILTVILFVAALGIGFRKKRISLSGIGLSLIATIAWLIMGVITVIAVLWMLGGASVNPLLMVGTLIAISLTLIAALIMWGERKKRVPALMVVYFGLWLAAQALMLVYAPSGSYLFAWPLLAALLGALYFFSAEEATLGSAKSSLILAIFATLPVLITLPMIYLTIVGLGIIAGLIIIVLLMMLFGLLIPSLAHIVGANKRLALGSLLSASLILIFITVSSRRTSIDRNQIFYNLDVDRGTATWSGVGERTEEFIAKMCPDKLETKFGHDNFPYVNYPFNSCDAPALHFISPLAETTKSLQKQDTRVLEIRIRSLRKAPMLIIQIENISQVLSAAVNGIAISNPKNISTDQAGDKWEMQFYAPPESGVNIMLEARSNEPVRMKIIDVSYELPSIPGHKFTIDQPDMKPGYFGLPDSTFISKSFSL